MRPSSSRRSRATPIALAATLALSSACGGGSGAGTGTNGGSSGAAGPYSLEVSTSSLSFAAERNSATPPAKTVTATFVGEGLVVGYPPGVSAPSWLTASATTSTGSPTSLSIRVNTTSLSPGDYRTTLRLVTGKADGSAIVWKDVAVEYVVTAGLQASATSLSFSGVDGVAPPQKAITLTADALPKAWTLAVEAVGSSPTDWVVLPAAAGTLSSASASVAVGAAARPPGSYLATLVVRDGAGASRARISLSYQVTAAFTLSGTLTARVTEAATLASLDLPIGVHTKLDAASGAGRTWQASSTASWLSIVPATGDLAGDANVVVRLDPAKLWALANGSYSGTVTVASDPGGATTASLPVSVTVSILPALAAPATVSWSIGVSSTATDLSRTAAVTSNLGEAFAGHGAWHATTPATWLQVTPSSSPGADQLTLAVPASSLATLANGAQAATVTIAAEDARVAGAKLQANVQVALPDAAHVAPYTTWSGRAPDLIVRGSGFGTAATLPVLVGSDTVTGTVVSDSEIRLKAPTQATARRVPVSIANALGVGRATSELVVLDPPAYAPYQASLATSPTRMVLDPERQAVLLGGAGGEVRRFRYSGDTWSTDAFSAPTVTGGYVTADGKALLVTSGDTGSSAQVFYEVDPATLVNTKQTGYSSYYARFDLAACLDDGRVLIIDSEQWAETIWYPSLARGVYLDAHGPFILLTRDRSRLIVADDGTSGISSYDASDAAATTRTVTKAPWYGRDWSVSGDGGRLAIDAAVYDRDFNFLGSASLPENPVSAVAVSPDGASLYTVAHDAIKNAWVFRRTDIHGAPPYTADATALPFAIGATETVAAMAVSEDGSALFLLTRAPTGSTGSIFRALPLP